MHSIVTCEFLLAPSCCDPKLIDDIVLDLMQIHADVTESQRPPLLENDAYLKLLSSNRFPTDKVFSANIKDDGVSLYGAQDITTIVNKILASAISLEDNDHYWISEWQNLSLTPEFDVNNIPGRKAELSDFFTTLTLFNLTQGTQACALHHHDTNAQSTKVSGTLTEAHPTTLPLPLLVDQQVLVYSRYKPYLSQVNPNFFFSATMSTHDLKLGIYAGALSILRDSGQDYTQLDWDSFSIGASFLESISDNQAGFGQRYFGTLIDCLTHIIAGRPKNQLSPFCTSTTSDEQITRDGNLAYRSHITKSGLALRLMHWKTPRGRLIFSNVGVKGELLIL